MNIRFEKIVSTLERDIAQAARNQILIDRMKTVTAKDKFMLALRQTNWLLITAVAFCLLLWSIAFALAEGNVQCPDPGQQCKILYLTQQEEKLLMGQNGVLDTAAQARALDLGQFSVYFKTRIAGSAQGEVKPLPSTPLNAPADKPLDSK